MKIRTGFVGNSSSSSFLIYGVYLDSAEIVGTGEDMLLETMEEEAYASKLYARRPFGDGLYIGLSLADIKDDETMGQFKLRVKALLKELFSDLNLEDVSATAEILEKAWNDG